MVDVCFYFQVHQPKRIKRISIFEVGKGVDYFDSPEVRLNNKAILDKVSTKCYIPATKLWLRLLEKHPELKLSFSFSGVLLEQLEEHREDVLNLFQQLADTKQVEFLGETYYHSLSFLYSKREFLLQVEEHKKAIKKYFNRVPKVFRNTELIYSNSIAKTVEFLGFKAVLGEGVDYLLYNNNPNFLYKAKGSKLKVLLRNYRLSDDISFRFSNREWEEHPLTADKFAYWLNNIKGDVVNLFMDYETFGEHQWEETGIFDFLAHLPPYLIKEGHGFTTPSEAIRKHKEVGEIDVEKIVSWADTERDLTAWLGNDMQKFAISKLYSFQKFFHNSRSVKKEESLIRRWRLLQTSDHFYYMCTKWFEDGDVHKYFNPYESPYEAFINFINALKDLEAQIKSRFNGENYGDLEEVENIFIEAPPDQKFFTKDGRELSNLIDLLTYLEVSEEADYHIAKGDFVRWIKNSLGLKELSKKLASLRSKNSIKRVIKKELSLAIEELLGVDKKRKISKSKKPRGQKEKNQKEVKSNSKIKRKKQKRD